MYFTQDMCLGVARDQVRELQKRLRTLGLFTYPSDTRYFGPVTKAAVIEYQALRGIVPVVGFVDIICVSEVIIEKSVLLL